MAGSIVLAVKSVFDDAGLKSAQKEFGSIGKKIKGVLAGVGIGVGLSAIVGSLTHATKAFEKAQVASSKLANVLDSMGVGFATNRVDTYAESLQNTLAIDADIIKATQTKLATFSELTKTIGESGGAFDRATVAALDLAAAGFGTAEGNAVQLGKALQDPIKGLTSLSKSGVTFTDAEKQKIKTLVQSNQVLEAQNIVLQAIEKQVGGTAEAGVSQFTRLQLIFDSMADQIGSALLPYVEQFADYLASPEGQIQMQRLANTIAVVVQALGNALIWLVQNKEMVAALAITITGLAAAIGIARIALEVYTLVTKNAAIAQALLDVAMGAINPAALAIGIAVLAGSMLLLASNTQEATDAQTGLNNASSAYTPPIQASPTMDRWDIRPLNPQPGQVYTFYKPDPSTGMAIWYTTTWTGSTWTKPVKMTYTPPETKKKTNAFTEFTTKMADDAKKLRAIGVLTGKGLSQGFAESIVNSGKDWQVVYQRVIGSNKTALMALQKQWNATSDGLKEIKDAKEKAYADQKKLDEEYAASVKDTFTGIRESIMAGFDITQMGKSASGLLSNINRLIAQTKKFADNIRTLAGQNLNATLLNQLIAAGPMEGGRLAASLVQSGLGTVQQLNASYAEFQGLSAGIAATGTMQQFGQKAGTVINMTVNAGMGTDAASVGRQVVDAISKYERQSGAVYVRA